MHYKLGTRTLVIVLALVTLTGLASFIPGFSSAARGYSKRIIQAIGDSNTTGSLKNTDLTVVQPANTLAQQQGETLARVTNAIPRQNTPLAVIYDTTHTAGFGAEITPTANGPATSMGDLIVLGGTNRRITQITIDVFTFTSLTPFNLTMSLYTDCSSNGASNSACGNGAGTLIPGSVVTVSNITPPSLGTRFSVNFPYLSLDLPGDFRSQRSRRRFGVDLQYLHFGRDQR